MFHFLLVVNISGKVCFIKTTTLLDCVFLSFLKWPFCAVLIKDVALNKLTWLTQSMCGDGKF